MIDTHCHIDDEAFASDREFVIARQRESGVQSIVVPGVGVESVQSVMTVCHAHPHYCLYCRQVSLFTYNSGF